MTRPPSNPLFCVHFQSAAESDPDELGIKDPAFDRTLKIGENENENALEDNDESYELDIGETVALLRNIGAEDCDSDLELDTGCLIDEPASPQHDDDQSGPLSDCESDLELTERLDVEDTDEGDGVADENTLDALPEIDAEQEPIDDSQEDVPNDSLHDMSDEPIGWATQTWSELKLRTTFVARRSLNARRNVLIAAGDAIDLLSLDDFEPVSDGAPNIKSSYANFLESTYRSVLIVKNTGQIVIWNRETGGFDAASTAVFSTVNDAAQVCCEPTDNQIWVRCANGQLLRSETRGGNFEFIEIPGRCVAITSNAQSMLCLTHQSSRLLLVSIARDGTVERKAPAELAGLARARDIMILALEETVVVGARGHGLWISTDGGRTFRSATGCRAVTAFAIGHYLGRDYVWAALFHELEDRTELVLVDLKSSKVQKLLEYRVMTDSQGPEDDPPERARIDGLLWDSSRHRIIAAGCFGLACFVPPQSSYPSS